MSVQLDVSTHGSSNSVSIALPSTRELGISEEEERATAAAILGCVGESARKDATLTEEQSNALQLQPSTRCEEEDTAVLVGRTIVNWADEIDQRLSEDELVRGLVDSCVSDSDSGRASHKTFQIFQRIVRIVLECDENGLATKMSYGRLAALFGLGYMLCRAFVKTHSVQLVCDFVKQVIGYVIRFLAASRFFSWLKAQGGWGTLLKSSLAIASTNNFIAVAGVITVVVGFVLLAVSYYKSSK